MRSVRLRGRPEVILSIHHPTLPPSKEDWDAHCQTCLEGLETARVMNVVSQDIVFTDGQGPNSAQRKQVADIVARSNSRARSAVVSSSSMVRGIVTAMKWLGIPIMAFQPGEWQQALAISTVTTETDIADLRERAFSVVQELGARPKALDVLLR